LGEFNRQEAAHQAGTNYPETTLRYRSHLVFQTNRLLVDFATALTKLN